MKLKERIDPREDLARTEGFNIATINDLKQAFKDEFGFDCNKILVDSRKRSVLNYRYALHYLAYIYVNTTLVQIGFELGNMDHSSIIHSKDEGEKMLNFNYPEAIFIYRLDEKLQEKNYFRRQSLIVKTKPNFKRKEFVSIGRPKTTLVINKLEKKQWICESISEASYVSNLGIVTVGGIANGRIKDAVFDFKYV